MTEPEADVERVSVVAGGGLDDDRMWDVVSRYLGRDGDWAWTAHGGLLDPRVAEQVERLLANRMTDIQQQNEIAGIDVELGDRDAREVKEWKARAKRMNLMLARRRGQVKPYAQQARVERADQHVAQQRRVERAVLVRLAAAVYAHEQAVLSQTDDEDTDYELWQMLRELTVPDGPYDTATPLRLFVESGRWKNNPAGGSA